MFISFAGVPVKKCVLGEELMVRQCFIERKDKEKNIYIYNTREKRREKVNLKMEKNSEVKIISSINMSMWLGIRNETNETQDIVVSISLLKF